jgi:hypothetical protein
LRSGAEKAGSVQYRIDQEALVRTDWDPIHDFLRQAIEKSGIIQQTGERREILVQVGSTEYRVACANEGQYTQFIDLMLFYFRNALEVKMSSIHIDSRAFAHEMRVRSIPLADANAPVSAPARARAPAPALKLDNDVDLTTLFSKDDVEIIKAAQEEMEDPIKRDQALQSLRAIRKDYLENLEALAYIDALINA